MNSITTTVLIFLMFSLLPIWIAGMVVFSEFSGRKLRRFVQEPFGDWIGVSVYLQLTGGVVAVIIWSPS